MWPPALRLPGAMSSTAVPWPSHRVRLDPDDGASRLRLFDDAGTRFGVSLDRFDLSPELRQELRAWSESATGWRTPATGFRPQRRRPAGSLGAAAPPCDLEQDVRWHTHTQS
jgi:hypothetical protein